VADIIIQEKTNLWTGKEPAYTLLKSLEQNPYGKFDKMSFGGNLKSYNYQFDKALKHLMAETTNSVRLTTETPFRFRGSIARGKVHNTVVLGMANPTFNSLNLEQLLSYTRSLAKLLPNFYRAEIVTDYQLNEYYTEQKLEWLPECFNDFLSWYHLMSPLAYEPYYRREELLAVPAHQVRELDNGWIEIINYADPLSYDQTETRGRIIAITNYLNAYRLDRKKVVAEV
jgi:hypothetical protein